MVAPVYMTTPELAEYLRYLGPNGHIAANKWIARNGVRRYWRGRAALVKQADVDAVLAGERATVEEGA